MRSGLSTILQTLTPESANVLNNSIAEAGRRNHSQTTPLHVAATLLAAPTGFLRQACIRSHPNSSHPLQCRALELCFSVALERLPNATQSPTVTEPPVSNALTAALKRAQAHQRRGCPEQQQQPLLAVKVELEQLIISVLDDPSVSRVMREAGFSSPAVKTTIEQSLNGNGFRPSPLSINRNLYLNPRFQITDETSVSSSPTNLYLNPRLQPQKQRNLSLNHFQADDMTRVIEIMSKSKKRNPILVCEFEPELIKKEILMRIQKGELSKEGNFKNAEVISMEFPGERSEIPAKINKLIEVIRTRIRSFGNDGGSNRKIIIDLGDLKWLVEQTPTMVVSDIGREIVAEMAKLVTEFGKENDNVWLMGTATCETYLRCQVYYSSIENDWDLQALPISSRSPFLGGFGTNGIFRSSLESLNSIKNSARMLPCCPECFHDYEQELAKLHELEKSSLEAKSNLPQWLQNAKAQCSETEAESDMKMPHGVNDQELLKKWIDICSKIHPNHNQSPRFVNMVTDFEPNRLLCQSQIGQQWEAPRSPVRTDLVLGPKEVHEDSPVKDFLGCISSEPQAKGKFINASDADSFKKLLKGLMKKAWWQPEAASTIATTVTQSGSRGSMWLLFAGPDVVGKKKMASVLARHVCGAEPITVYLGLRRDLNEMDIGFRGKTALDRVAEAVRANPFSVIVLSDIDEADMLVRGSMKQAMGGGRLTDSHGREISIGNIIFVLTGNWSSNNTNEQLLPSVASDGQLKLTVCEKRSKRQADCLSEKNAPIKQQKKIGSGLSLDLNLAMDVEEDRTDTSDLTIEQGEENPHFASRIILVPNDLVGPSDGLVVFKPVQFGIIREEIEKTIKNTFSAIVDDKLSVEVNEAILDNILSELWFGRTDLEDWAEQILVPSIQELVGRLPSSVDDLVVRIELDRELGKVNFERE